MYKLYFPELGVFSISPSICGVNNGKPAPQSKVNSSTMAPPAPLQPPHIHPGRLALPPNITPVPPVLDSSLPRPSPPSHNGVLAFRGVQRTASRASGSGPSLVACKEILLRVPDREAGDSTQHLDQGLPVHLLQQAAEQRGVCRVQLVGDVSERVKRERGGCDGCERIW